MVLIQDAAVSIGLALLAVFVIVLTITGSLLGSLYVIFAVALVIYFLLGLISFWDCELNSISFVNTVIAIGLAVDYSAHIMHAYLSTDNADPTGVEKNPRIYKAKRAIATIGASVFHGAFSTFLAILAISPSKSYIFEVFFKLWFGIIIFGMGSGFILLPVLLSFIGPVGVDKPKSEEASGNEKKVNDKINNKSLDLEIVAESKEGPKVI